MESAHYLGGGLDRMEICRYLRSSDRPQEEFQRESADNGRTWSAWREMRLDMPRQNHAIKEEMPFAVGYDPAAKRSLQMWFQRIFLTEVDEAYRQYFQDGKRADFDHMFWRWSRNEGATWSALRQLKSGAGPEFDPADWTRAEYLRANELYGAYSLLILDDGTVVYPACERATHRNADGSVEQVTGLRFFLGRWSAAANDYQWRASSPLTLSHRQSGRGLMEPSVAELDDGRLFLAGRGANFMTAGDRKIDDWHGEVQPEGHCWISVSSDRGETWRQLEPLRYDDGEPCRVPDSMARLVRSRKTNRVYWIGNLRPTIPNGSLPRYPLHIAALLETDPPVLERATVTVIDDRVPDHDSEHLQLSNFKVLENRETLDLELWLTRYGERPDSVWGNAAFWSANMYRYVIRLD